MKEGIPPPSNDNEEKKVEEEVEINGTKIVEFRNPQEQLSENEKYGRAFQGQTNEKFISRVDTGIAEVGASFARDRERIQETLDRLKDSHEEVPMTQEQQELDRKWGEEGEETLKLGAQLYPLQFPTTEKSALTGNFNKDLYSEMESRKEKDTKKRQQTTLGILGLGAVSAGAAAFGGVGLASVMAIGGPVILGAGLGVYGGMRLIQGIRNRRYKKDAIKYAQNQKLQNL